MEKLKERNKKRIAFERQAGLEERAKEAAESHIKERANHLEAVRARATVLALNLEKKPERHGSKGSPQKAVTDGEHSPRKSRMLQTTARSLRSSLKGERSVSLKGMALVESGKAVVQSPLSSRKM